MTIFLSVISENGLDLINTINDAYDKAKFPKQLRFGVLDGSEKDQYSRLPAWRDQIRYIWIRSHANCDRAYSRAIVQGMINGEDYLFQVSTFIRFEQDWDAILISQMQRIPWRSVLTSIPLRRDPTQQPRSLNQNELFEIVSHRSNILEGIPAPASVDPDNGPLRGDRLYTDCLFSRGCLYDHVPYDHRIAYDHEDYTYGLRVTAAGWCIYHPLQVPIYYSTASSAQYQKTGDDIVSSDVVAKTALAHPGSVSRLDDVMKGCAGIYSLSTSISPNQYRKSNEQISLMPSSSISEGISDATRLELQSLSLAIAPMIYGTHSPLEEGDHSSFVNRVSVGANTYVLKSSTYDVRIESVVHSLFFKNVVKTEGSCFVIARPLLSISMIKYHYILYSYIEHLSLGSIQYRRLPDYRYVFRAIGEFNAANRDQRSFSSIPRKAYQLYLNESRLARRFPGMNIDILNPLLFKARDIHERLSELRRDIASSNYSFSHNDLHRKNIGIVKATSVRENSRVVLMDFSRACWAPLGNDLFFFVFYLIMAKASADSWLNLIDEYRRGLIMCETSLNIESSTIAAAAIIGYAEAWLNIHKRPFSSFDWYLFNVCIDLCERYLEKGWPAVLDELPSLYQAHESKRPS